EFIDSILYSENTMKVAVMGMGHLGQAITKYFNSKQLNIRITAAFDVDDAKVGQTIMDIPCYHINDFEEVVENNDISIVIISLQSSLAAQYTVPIINAGIKGVLNFTSVPMNFPQGIVVENYDITTILEKVAYFVKAAEENNNQ
ncbi:MAG: Gfo/Idh/MocA family oxidoreductase, partial [Alistipes sp.]|nr:Gfo/Idh/MocA family oxidoreductase [Alistipes sp.]